MKIRKATSLLALSLLAGLTISMQACSMLMSGANTSVQRTSTKRIGDEVESHTTQTIETAKGEKATITTVEKGKVVETPQPRRGNRTVRVTAHAPNFDGAAKPQAPQGDYVAHIPTRVGATLTYTNFDEHGKEIDHRVYTVKDVTEKRRRVDILTQLDQYSPKGKHLGSIDITFHVRRGAFYGEVENSLDPKTVIAYKKERAAIWGAAIVWPAQFKIGDKLPDSMIKVDPNERNNSQLKPISLGTFDRKVVGVERITTPAGTFDCFVVESTSTLSLFEDFRMAQVDWFAPGIGVIKTEMYNNNGTVSSSTELTELNR